MRIRVPAGRSAVDADGGSIAPAVPLLAMMILLLGGLVLDASRQLNARGRAVAYAEEAARSGASAIDLASPTLRLIEPDAIARAQRYCADMRRTDSGAVCDGVGIEPSPDAGGARMVVHVHVRVTLPATLLGIVGVTQLQASGDGRARPIEGIDRGDAR
jgi:hypothetical protein